MKIFVWNVNYWEHTKGKLCNTIEWKNKCIEFMKNEKDVDFYILQEINPIKLFEKTPNQYEFSMTDYNILYQELLSELLYDGRRDNFWGNAIIYKKKYEVENNKGLIDFSKPSKNYYGRNGIMCYKFVSNKKENIIITNYYNKNDYLNKTGYDRTKFENDEEIINIFNKPNDRIILAGDFNTGFKNNDKSKKDYDKFIGMYEKYNFKDCNKNYSPNFIPTSYWYLKYNGFYLNDFCFSKNMGKTELLNKKDEWEEIGKKKLWKGLSDHRPLIFNIS
jgi:hypothetical protein